MAIPPKALLGDIGGVWLEHCMAPELLVSKFIFACFSLNPLKHFHIGCMHPLLVPLCVVSNTHYQISKFT